MQLVEGQIVGDGEQTGHQRADADQCDAKEQTLKRWGFWHGPKLIHSRSPDFLAVSGFALPGAKSPCQSRRACCGFRLPFRNKTQQGFATAFSWGRECAAVCCATVPNRTNG